MLEQLRAQIAAKLEERKTKREALESVLEGPTAEARDLNEDETSKFNELKAEVKAVDSEIDTLRSRVSELEELDSRDKERSELAASIQPKPNKNPDVRIGHEPKVYDRGSPNSFFLDAYAARTGMGGPDTMERLERHQAEVRSGAHGEENRAAAASTNTGSFSSLVVPQYLPEMFAANLHAGRVTADLASGHPLPDEGMTLTIPRATNPTLTGAQSDQNTNVASQTFDSEDLVVHVRTYAGQQNVSRQAIERGRGTDEVIYADLAGDYVSRLDRDVLHGPGNAGRHLGILNSGVATVTASSTDGVAIVRNIGEAIGTVNGARLLPPDAIVMHPRRWAYLAVTLDGAERPLVVPGANQPSNVFGVGEPAAVEQQVGQILGVPVYTDANVSTSLGTTDDEDAIVVMRRSDLHLWEEGVAPRQFRFEETLGGQLTVKLVIAGYSAFTARHRPEAVAVVTGNGLVPPVF